MVEQHIKELLPDDIKKLTVIGELPSVPRNVIAIMLFSGAGNAEYFACDTVCTPVIKIVARNQSYEQAKHYIEELKMALHRHHDEYFMSIFMQGYPMYLGKDEQKLHEFQIVFNINVKE